MSTSNQAIEGVPQLTPDDAARALESGAFLLDVREPNEWSAGHAPAATHIPLGQLGDRYATALPKEHRIVVVCRSGARSQRAAAALVSAGYDAANLAGGMQAWASSGREVVGDEGQAGTVI